MEEAILKEEVSKTINGKDSMCRKLNDKAMTWGPSLSLLHLLRHLKRHLKRHRLLHRRRIYSEVAVGPWADVKLRKVA